MYFTAHNQVIRKRDMTTVFGGYNHRLSCQDGEFFDMQNMTTEYYPILSPRKRRGICREFTKPQMLADRDGLVWIDNNYLYVNGEKKTYCGGYAVIDEALSKLPVVPVKMGTKMVMTSDWAIDMETLENDRAVTEIATSGIPSYVIPAPDDLKMYAWPHGRTFELDSPPVGATEGTHAIFLENGRYYMREYDAENDAWNRVSTNYAFIEVNCGNIGAPYLEEGQTVTLRINNKYNDFDPILSDFSDIGDGYYEMTTKVVKLVSEGELNNNWMNRYYEGFIIEMDMDECVLYHKTEETRLGQDGLKVIMERIHPKLLTECNNRLWGCSEDGHEIYATALGSWKRWQAFEGIATDSYAVTIGSDGAFTGSVTYNGNPIFFKENSMIKVTVSSTGAHQIKEIVCPGVQKGSENSICIIKGILYYKGVEGIYAYDGSLPVLISAAMGEKRYHDATAGAVLDRYYISMKDEAEKNHLFVYDTETGMWAHEDDTQALVFCRSGSDLYYVDCEDNTLKSVRGTLPYENGTEEEAFDWYAESGNIGFYMPDKKRLAKIQIRLAMEQGTNISIFLQYDSSGNWVHICNMNGTGTRSYEIPIIPQRCDHFKYMIAGRGGCKVFSVTKTIEEGSGT